ncbi:MAG: DUF4337 domain-containing protein [Beijerinckiaceae bacterium]|nr:DUF4337 domain-containing protein [Beijerinckiaceae bacterium]
MTEPVDITEAASTNKRVALLIALLALFLALSDLGGGNADNDAVEFNVQSANLWAFYQAKTIRRTSTLLAAEEMETRLVDATPEARAIMEKRIAEWRKTAERYETEPETGEGRRELMAKALQATRERDVQKAKGDTFDVATALLQVSIVLASAAIITGALGLAMLAGGLGLIGVALVGGAFFAPTYVSQFF